MLSHLHLHCPFLFCRMDGVTHSTGGEPQDGGEINDWPMPFNQIPDVGGGLMRNHSFSDFIGGLSGLINLQNNHQNQGQGVSPHQNFTSQNQESHSVNVTVMSENTLENYCPPVYDGSTNDVGTDRLSTNNSDKMYEEVLGSPEIEKRSFFASKVNVVETKVSMKDVTKRRGRGRKRKGNVSIPTFGEGSKVLFIVAPLNDQDHKFKMRSSNIKFSAVWSYLKTCVNKDNDILLGGSERDGIICFGDEMMMVAMEFLCSLFDARKGTINSSGVVKGRVTEVIYSSSIVTLLNDCCFMSSR